MEKKLQPEETAQGQMLLQHETDSIRHRDMQEQMAADETLAKQLSEQTQTSHSHIDQDTKDSKQRETKQKETKQKETKEKENKHNSNHPHCSTSLSQLSLTPTLHATMSSGGSGSVHVVGGSALTSTSGALATSIVATHALSRTSMTSTNNNERKEHTLFPNPSRISLPLSQLLPAPTLHTTMSSGGSGSVQSVGGSASTSTSGALATHIVATHAMSRTTIMSTLDEHPSTSFAEVAARSSAPKQTTNTGSSKNKQANTGRLSPVRTRSTSAIISPRPTSITRAGKRFRSLANSQPDPTSHQHKPDEIKLGNRFQPLQDPSDDSKAEAKSANDETISDAAIASMLSSSPTPPPTPDHEDEQHMREQEEWSPPGTRRNTGRRGRASRARGAPSRGSVRGRATNGRSRTTNSRQSEAAQHQPPPPDRLPTPEELAQHGAICSHLPRNCTFEFQQAAIPILRKYEAASSGKDEQSKMHWMVQLMALPALSLGKPQTGASYVNTYKRKLRRIRNNLKDGITNIASSLINSEQPQLHGDETDEIRCLKRAQSFIRQNFLAKAAQAITQQPIMDAQDPSVVTQLRDLHPDCKDPMPKLPDNAPKILICTRTHEEKHKFRLLLNKMNTGSAGGPSGLTMSHLVALSKNDDCLSGIAKMVEDICNGSVSQQLRPYLTTSTLIPIPKHNSSAPRPIAIGEVLYRVAASYVCSLVLPAAQEHCQPYQFGIGTPNGCAQVHLALQARLDAGSFAFLGDIRSAFNEIHRPHTVTEVYNDHKLKLAWRFIDFAYGQETLLRLKGGTHIKSRQGVKQGDPNGSWSYAVGKHPIYREAASVHPDVDLFAIADDAAFVSTNILHIVDAVTTYEAACKRINLHLQWPKCKLMVPPTAQLPPEAAEFFASRNVTIVNDATMHLGAPLGWSEEKAKELIAHTIDQCAPMFQRLKHDLLTRQEAYQILRVCTLPKLGYLTRVVRPAWLQPTAERFDALLFETATAKLGLPDLKPKQVTQFHLKLKNGGLGLPKTSLISPIAFVSSTIASASLLNEPRVLGELRKDSLFSAAIINAIADTRAQLKHNSDAMSLLPPEAAITGDRYKVIAWITGNHKGAKQAERSLQHTLTHAADTFRAETLRRKAKQADKARLHASTAQCANVWLSNAPSTREKTLKNEEFANSVRIRLGLPHSDHLVTGCVCGQPHADPQAWLFDIRHDLSCTKFKHIDVTQRHDMVKTILHKWANRLGAASVIEWKFDDSKNRADIRITFPNGQDYVIDVVITNPTSPSAIGAGSYKKPLAAASKAAKRKVARYKKLKLLHKNDVFVPFAAEADGGLSDQAKNFITTLSHLADDDNSCRWTQTEAFKEIIAEIAIAIQRGNHRISQRALNNNIRAGLVVRQDPQSSSPEAQDDTDFHGDDRDLPSSDAPDRKDEIINVYNPSPVAQSTHVSINAELVSLDGFGKLDPEAKSMQRPLLNVNDGSVVSLQPSLANISISLADSADSDEHGSSSASEAHAETLENDFDSLVLQSSVADVEQARRNRNIL
jgi:hypothetical protein